MRVALDVTPPSRQLPTTDGTLTVTRTRPWRPELTLMSRSSSAGSAPRAAAPGSPPTASARAALRAAEAESQIA